MKVVEIFKSIDGEGKRTGLPTTFIRLFGCNLHCSYCDTRYGCEGNDYTEMSVQEILDKVEELGLSSITVTGGEPLINSEIYSLLEELVLADYWINIETNGSIDLGKIPKASNMFFTMDYKCPTSLMENKMNLDNFRYLTRKDVLKFVVGSLQDLDKAKEILIKYNPCCKVYISPVFEKIEPKEIVDYVLKHNLNNCYVQVQLHKIIWNPEERGV